MTIFRRMFRTPEVPVSGSSGPLDHPDVKRMTLRELADLPLPYHANSAMTDRDAAALAAHLTVMVPK